MSSQQSSVWNRCTLVNLDQPGRQVEAYFNPKEISFDKKVPWSSHKASKQDIPALEFTNAMRRNRSSRAAAEAAA